ncbi:MAG: helix-turn-helix domain-containing protein [Clostridium sp.]
MKLGQNLKIILKEKKMSLRELNRKSGVALSSLSELINGRHKNMRVESVVRIAKALEVTLDELVLENKESD